MQLTRRMRIGAGLTTAVLALAIGTTVVLASRAGGRDGGDRAAAADEERPERDQRERTTTTSTTLPAASTTTTVAPVAPATTAPRGLHPNGGDDDAPPGSPPPPPPAAPPPPPPPLPPAPTPTPWVDTRPEAIDYSASCRTAGPTTVVGTARIVWSDGFVDEFSVTFTSPGYNQTVGGGQRGWWLTLNVVAPPDGAIGDYTCSNASTGGPLRWDG